MLLTDYAFSLVFPLSGFVTGILVQKFIVRKVRRIAEKTQWIWDDIVISSISGLIIPMFILIGCYGALNWLTIEKNMVEKIEKGFFVAWALLATIFCSRFIKGILSDTVGTVGKSIPSVSIMNNFAGVLIYGIGFLMVLQSLGVSITPVLTALGVGGLAVALALQDTLSNFFSGMNIILSKQIHVGDFIKVDGGPEGFVTDITWRNTAIRTLPNNLVVFPNSKLAATSYTNYTMPDPEMAVLVDVGVDYSSDLEKVERVTIETARTVLKKFEGSADNFDPFIRYNSFGERSINFTVILRAKQFTDQYLLKHLFIKELALRFRAENITIPFPVRTLHIVNREVDK